MRITVNGTPYEVEVEVLDDRVEGRGYGFPSHERRDHGAHNAPAQAAISKGITRPPSPNKKELTSPIAGTVMEIKVKPGDQVAENDLLMVIEAMKMNTHISSPVAGTIAKIAVAEKDGVTQGQVLVVFQ
jgi:biotin carboxyl carrier protein